MQLKIFYDIIEKNIVRYTGLFGGKFMVCCVTGHRPQGFPFEREIFNSVEFNIYLDKLYKITEGLICEGYNYFITGMAAGADIDFAQSILYFRNFYEHIKLEAALPYPIGQTKTMTEYRDDKDLILKTCDTTKIISPYFFKGCMQKRNRYMVDNSDLVLAIWNGQGSPHITLCCSVTQSCSTPCIPMDCSMPDFPILHHLPEFAQIHVN